MMRHPACLVLITLLVTGAAAAETPTIPKFVEETASSGIASTYSGDWEFTVGGGVATFDCNDDGLPEAYLAGGTAPAKFFRNVSAVGGPLRFVEEAKGLEFDRVTGAYPIDIDSDGVQDLVILRSGENVVMRGLGNCSFTRANGTWGFAGGDGWSTALAATWEKGLAWPTLAIGNYVNRREEISPWGSCTDNWLHRPRADGAAGFAPPLPLTPSYCALSMLFTDWNRSGTPALRISNDREYYEGGQEQMWKMPPMGSPSLYSEAEGWKYLRIWGMGIDSYDITGDGYPDYFMTSMADNKLQTLAEPGPDARPTYKDIAYARGVTAHRPYMGEDLRPSTAWHTQFEDVNNDGYVDLFIAKGNVAEMPDFAQKDPNNLMLQKDDGKFVDVGGEAGMGSTAIARGGAVVDFNLDGLLDILVVNRWSPAQIWRNTGPAGHWIEVKPRQPAPNRDAANGWLEVKLGERILRRELTIGGGHVSGRAGFHHFGLGSATAAQIRVTWPDGTAGDWQEVAADHFYVLPRGAAPEPWQPAR
jgi:hypothetical protein